MKSHQVVWNSYISGFLLGRLSMTSSPHEALKSIMIAAIKLGLVAALHRPKEVTACRENSLYAGGILPRD